MTFEDQKESLRIRDLVEVPEIRTVIQLEDLKNPTFRPADKYETSRYIHGKDSPFEVIIPWAWIMRL